MRQAGRHIGRGMADGVSTVVMEIRVVLFVPPGFSGQRTRGTSLLRADGHLFRTSLEITPFICQMLFTGNLF